jgi:ABC-type transporter Mla subunit MlaD
MSALNKIINEMPDQLSKLNESKEVNELISKLDKHSETLDSTITKIENYRSNIIKDLAEQNHLNLIKMVNKNLLDRMSDNENKIINLIDKIDKISILLMISIAFSFIIFLISLFLIR